MKNRLIHFGSIALYAAVFSGCVKLKPDPLSFYEPSLTFSTKEGLQAAITSSNRHMRYYFYGEAAPFYTDLLFSDVAVDGTTDKSGPAQNIDQLVTPTSNNLNDNTNKINWFWTEGYKSIRYSNAVVSNIDKVEGLDSATYGEMLGKAYFHRSWRYLGMVFQFGDIPLMTQEATSAKFNYQSSKMSVVLEKITADMEYAVAHVPAKTNYGDINKGACLMLLIKCYLATGQFDKAINTANTLIGSSGYTLVKNNFGTFINPMPAVHNITRNVIWDLHRPENKSIAANTETIYVMTSREGFDNSIHDLVTMRNATPFWAGSGSQQINTPSGRPGMSASYAQTNTKIDQRKAFGRGIAKSRGTWYATNTIWDDPADLRHSSATGNWMRMEDMVYNNPALLTAGDANYGRPLQMRNGSGQLLIVDTIRSWFAWPHYKLWIATPRAETVDNYNGGAADWYVYRLAEAYLLRAEAYFWKGDLANAAADINTIRQRAGCTVLYGPGEINMGTIMDERARELTYEELRHTELSRVSYIFALTGKTDEFGKSYTVADLAKSSYWFERVNRYNDFYNKGVKTVYGVEYKISPFHIFWPVPQTSIDANREGRINQNYGYAGYEKNVPPFTKLNDALDAEK
jgi:starch-binding outer membrane protein, SusD/RagB family